MSFSKYHPAVNFIYFTIIIFFGMLIRHPAFIAISLISSILYSGTVNGIKSVGKRLKYMILLILVMAVINSLVNRKGQTVIFMLFGTIPIHLESLIYGLSTASMFVSIIFWFSCLNAVLTADKIHFLFSRISPSLSLMFSMILRFIPRLTTQLKAVSGAYRCLGRDTSSYSSLMLRIRHSLSILFSVITWVLENAVETSDSMRARGFGLPGRTSYSTYTIKSGDVFVLTVILLLCSATVYSMASGVGDVIFFPSMLIMPASPSLYIGLLCYCTLCFFPIIIDTLEAIRWKLSLYEI